MVDLKREFKNDNVTTMTGEIEERFMETASEVAGELLGNEGNAEFLGSANSDYYERVTEDPYRVRDRRRTYRKILYS